MSATLGKDLGERLAAMLGEADDGAAPQPAPLLVSAGRQFPVKVTHLGSPGLPGENHILNLVITANSRVLVSRVILSLFTPENTRRAPNHPHRCCAATGLKGKSLCCQMLCWIISI